MSVIEFDRGARGLCQAEERRSYVSRYTGNSSGSGNVAVAVVVTLLW